MKIILAAAFVGIATMGAILFSEFAGFTPPQEKVIHVRANKFEFSPSEIKVKKGEPVTIEIESADVRHGFNLPDFHVRADIKPGAIARIRLIPDKTGSFIFTCDVFCGSGHEEMSGTLIVTE